MIGKGSKGNMVYSGTLLSSGKHLAVKVTYARRLRKLQHPNIIKCLIVEDVGTKVENVDAKLDVLLSKVGSEITTLRVLSSNIES